MGDDTIRKVQVELRTAAAILSNTHTDWDQFDKTSKKLGSNAERVLKAIKDRVEAAEQCIADAMKVIDHA